MTQTLILHVGTGKTGTSFLQEFLARNRDPLRERDIYFPDAGRAENASAHHKLEAALSGSREWWMQKDISAPDILRDIVEEIETNGCAYNVISEEGLVWLPAETIQLLATRFERFAVRIVIDVRRHDVFADSALNQVVKSAGRRFSFEQLWRYDGTWFVPDYFAHMDRWAKVFGRENIVVRPYEKGQIAGRDIVDDFFLRTCGFTVDVDRVVSQKTRNPRLSRSTLEFKRLMNFLFAERPALTLRMLAPLYRWDERQGRRDQDILSDSVRRAILEATAGQNRRIVETFDNYSQSALKLRPGLFLEPFEPTGQDPFEGLAAEDAASILEDMAQAVPDLYHLIVHMPLPAETPPQERAQILALRGNAG